jgi:hypothetical protein
MNKKRPRLKEWTFRIISVMFGLTLVLGTLEIAMRFLPVNDIYAVLPVNAQHPLIHFPPHSTQQYSIGWQMLSPQHKHANNDGYYSDYDYVPTNLPVMAVIGDSFIQAAQVADNETLQARLQQSLNGRGKVYGFGVQGAPLSQYLMFVDYARQHYQPSAMVITIIANDFDQSIKRYGSQVFEGMYVYSDATPQAQLELLDYTGPKQDGWRGLVKHSALFRYLYDNVGINPKQLLARFRNADPHKPVVHFGGVDAAVEPQRLEDSRQAVELFFRDLPGKTGLSPDKILFVLDGIREVKTASDWQAAQNSYFGQMRNYFTQAARQRGYSVLDMHLVFHQAQQVGEKVDFIPQDWHWNSYGHKLVADAIRQTQVFQQTFAQ